jgi:PPK2 family polyphosphate:nucleotide phosphotransferase
MPNTHRLSPNTPIRLPDLPTHADSFHTDRQAAEKEFKKLSKEMAELQNRFYSEGKRKLLIVLQAMDAGGKDGTIRRVTQGVNPQGVRVTSFKAPSKRELAHDYLWRVHREVPGKGMIGIFNRSHYEDVLVVRVDDLVPEHVWQQRYDQINQFEKLLCETGTTILKLYLHISKDEQQTRFQDRINDSTKNWKFSREDLEKRKQWDDYMQAYEDVLNRCTTPWAPWFAIPSDQKWYRNLAISRVLHATLTALNPQFPAHEDLSGITVT